MNAHVINTETFDLFCNNEAVATNVRKNIQQQTAFNINEIITSVLSEYAADEKNYAIEKIEIDLGNINLDDFGEQNMLNNFRELFMLRVAGDINLINERWNDIQRTPHYLPADTGADNVSFLNESTDNDFRILTSFLLSGDLPWWTDKNESLKLKEVLEKIIIWQPESFKTLVIRNKTNRNFFSRLFELSASARIKGLVKSKAVIFNEIISELYNTAAKFFPALYKLNNVEDKVNLNEISKGEISNANEQELVFQNPESQKDFFKELFDENFSEDLNQRVNIASLLFQKTDNLLFLFKQNLFNKNIFSEEVISKNSSFFPDDTESIESFFSKKDTKKIKSILNADSQKKLVVNLLSQKLNDILYLLKVNTSTSKKNIAAIQKNIESFLRRFSIAQANFLLFQLSDLNNDEIKEAVLNNGLFVSIITSQANKKNITNKPAKSKLEIIPGELQQSNFQTQNGYKIIINKSFIAIIKIEEYKLLEAGSLSIALNEVNEKMLSNSIEKYYLSRNSLSADSKEYEKAFKALKNDFHQIINKPIKNSRKFSKNINVNQVIEEDIQVIEEGIKDIYEDRNIKALPNSEIKIKPGSNQVNQNEKIPGIKPFDIITTEKPLEEKEKPNVIESTANTIIKAKINFILSRLNLKSEKNNLYNYLSSLNEADLDEFIQILKSISQNEKVLKQTISSIIKHPNFFRYNLLKLYFNITITVEKISLLNKIIKVKNSKAKNDDKAKEKIKSQVNQSLKSFDSEFISLINKLSLKDLIVLKDVLQKKNLVTKSEEKSIKRILLKLPEQGIRLMDFFTSLPEQKLEQLSFYKEENGAVKFFSEDIQPQKIYIENAGICLIAPYLTTLFKHLNFIEGKEFKNISFAIRALYIIQYIATGKNKYFEYQLQLNKLLCGFDVQDYVPAFIRLTKKEMQEADKLINSVIENWKGLKRTSAEGFRQTFLQRKGILTADDFKWTLQVERKGFDILLSIIPWSYSIIKLPWMKKHIQVEW